MMANLNPVNVNTITKEQENGLRIWYLLNKTNEELRNIFHRSFSRDPHQLYKELAVHRVPLNKLKQQDIIKQEQWIILFPRRIRETKSSEFDTSLLMLLLRTLCILPEPATKWGRPPDPNDVSESAQVVEITLVRNKLAHSNLSLDNAMSNSLYKSLKKAMLNLGCSELDIEAIKTIGIDRTDRNLLEDAIDETKDLQIKISKLEQCLENLENHVAHLENCLEGVWWSVHHHANNFTGRDIDVQKLHHLICSASHNQYGVVITGYGGIGKTELASFYCHKFVREYDSNIIWINADDENATEDSFIKLAKYLKLSIIDADGKLLETKLITQKIYTFFAGRKSLFVFDNAPNEGTFSKYLPSTIPPGHLRPSFLITSQYTQWSQSAIKYDLDVLSNDSALQFMQDNLPSMLFNIDHAKNLLEKVERLPLALQLAASFILKHQISIEEFIRLFEENIDHFLSKNVNVSYNKTIHAAFSMALTELKKRENVLAETIMTMMAFMDGKQLEEELFLLMIDDHKLELFEAFEEMEQYSIIRSNSYKNYEGIENVSFTMHTLIQEMIINNINNNTDNEERNFVIQIVMLVDLLKLKKTNKFHISFGEIWLHHLLRLIDRFKHSASIMELMEVQKSDIATALLESGKYELSISIMEIYIKFEKKRYVQDMEHAMMSLHIIAICHLKQGRIGAAFKLFQQVYEKRKSILGEGHPETLGSQHHAAICLQKEGQINAALEIFKEVYEKLQNAEDINPFFFDVQSNIASCLLELGCVTMAHNIYETLHEDEKAYFADEHPNTLKSQFEIGLCFLHEENVTTALKVVQEVYEKGRNILGDMHPDTLKYQGTVSKCLCNLRNFDSASEMTEEVYEKQTAILGETHPDSLSSLHDKAFILMVQGNTELALTLMKEVHTKRKRVQGSKHPHTLWSQYCIAKCLNELGDPTAALTGFKDVYKNQKVVLGEKSPATLNTKYEIAMCLQETKDFEEALKLSEEVHAEQKEVMGPEHPATLRTQYLIATCLDAQGNPTAALEMAKEVYTYQKHFFGKDAPSALVSKSLIGSCFLQQGLISKALKVMKKVHERCKVVFGDKDPNTMMAQSKVGLCLLDQGNIKEALRVLNDVYAKMKVIHGEKHLLTTRAKFKIGYCLMRQLNHTDALKIFEEVMTQQKELLGDKHPDMLELQFNIAVCHLRRFDIAEAMKYALK